MPAGLVALALIGGWLVTVMRPEHGERAVLGVGVFIIVGSCIAALTEYPHY